MKKSLLIIIGFAALSFSLSAQNKNSLSIKERHQGYTLLFDGKTTHGWHAYLQQTAGAWIVVDGALQVNPQAPGQADLITRKEYENFELKLDWKIPIGGNSGIIFGVREDTTYTDTFLTGMEMQVLDDKGAEDNKKPNHLAGSLYDMIAPLHPAKPAGEWNSVIISKLNGRLTFWMNSQKVVEVQIGSKEWDELLQKSKFNSWKAFATYPKGHIALQDHGAAVAFRNIRIRKL
jgi:hypothetical protein